MKHSRRRSPVPPAILAAVGVVTAVVGVAWPQPSGPNSPLPAERLQTPLLSLRRMPDLLAQTVGALRLNTTLDAALSEIKLNGKGAASCLVVQQGDTVVFARRSTQPVIPASNLKLLTATAALDKLGPTARFVTNVMVPHPPVGGRVTGNLYLVGGGDPLLRTADYVAGLHYPEVLYTHLEDLAQAVKAAGITRVSGAVVGDESRYDTQRYVPTWKPDYAVTGEVGPMSALQVDDGFVSINPTVVPAPQPAVQAASVFTALLRQRGIIVGGAPAQGVTPAGAVTVASLPSAPLVDVLGEILRQSDNTGAELVTKELGRQFANQPTTAGGVAVIRADLQADGLPIDQLAAVDGSGLDRSDRASCQLILGTLLRSGPQGPLGQDLPVAGQSGTLVGRFLRTPAAGRLRAKTGTLDSVAALSGFVDPAGPKPAPGAAPPSLTFSLIVNGLPSGPAGELFEDRIGLLLAQYPQAPVPDRLAPLAATASR